MNTIRLPLPRIELWMILAIAIVLLAGIAVYAGNALSLPAVAASSGYSTTVRSDSIKLVVELYQNESDCHGSIKGTYLHLSTVDFYQKMPGDCMDVSMITTITRAFETWLKEHGINAEKATIFCARLSTALAFARAFSQ